MRKIQLHETTVNTKLLNSYSTKKPPGILQNLDLARFQFFDERRTIINMVTFNHTANDIPPVEEKWDQLNGSYFKRMKWCSLFATLELLFEKIHIPSQPAMDPSRLVGLLVFTVTPRKVKSKSLNKRSQEFEML